MKPLPMRVVVRAENVARGTWVAVYEVLDSLSEMPFLVLENSKN